MADVVPEPLEAVHTRWSEVLLEQMNPLITRQFITGERAMIARIDLKKGAVVPWHSHVHEQIAWIVEGALKFTLREQRGEREVVVHAGDVLIIPGNLSHMAEALEDTVDYDIFAPPREDWIAKEDAYLRG